MPLIRLPRAPALMLLPLLMLLAACGSASLPSRPVPQPSIPPLPAQARQTDSPEHSRRAVSDIETWLQPQTAPSTPGTPASAPTSR